MYSEKFHNKSFLLVVGAPKELLSYREGTPGACHAEAEKVDNEEHDQGKG